MKLSLTLLAVALPVALSTVAMANTVIYGPTSFPTTGTYSAGDSGSYNVPQFNIPGATLTAVKVTVLGTSVGGFNSITNVTAGSDNASVNIGSNITVSGPSSVIILTTPYETASNPALGSFETLSITGTSSHDTKTATLVAAFGDDLSPYVGSGDVTFNFTSAANLNLSSSTTYSAGGTAPTFDFASTVQYFYTPATIPEPASLGLLGVGALGLLAKRRRA